MLVKQLSFQLPVEETGEPDGQGTTESPFLKKVRDIEIISMSRKKIITTNQTACVFII